MSHRAILDILAAFCHVLVYKTNQNAKFQASLISALTSEFQNKIVKLIRHRFRVKALAEQRQRELKQGRQLIFYLLILKN